MAKPTLCLDFDGVIHSYASGWKGADVIPDPPVPGAFEFLHEAVRHFTVAVFSSRSNQPGGIPAMQAWLAHWSRVDLPPGAPAPSPMHTPTLQPPPEPSPTLALSENLDFLARPRLVVDFQFP